MDNDIRIVDDKGNKFIGTTPLMINSDMRFNGCNNVLFCDNQVTLVDSKLEFEGNDAHLIYCCNDGKRINQSESVFIGDHVWIGQQVTILKGTKIDSGCIVGANSLLPSKKVSHNCMWGGNPARQLKSDVFWDKTLTYGFDEKMTRLSENYSKFLDENREDCCKDYWIYQYNEEQEIKWEKFDRILSRGSVMEKCSILYELNQKRAKNRFVHK